MLASQEEKKGNTQYMHRYNWPLSARTLFDTSLESNEGNTTMQSTWWGYRGKNANLFQLLRATEMQHGDSIGETKSPKASGGGHQKFSSDEET